ncbi:MAG: hypothetical protein Kow0029_03180 [Candidatus Rifleibacteriota bacterium]
MAAGNRIQTLSIVAGTMACNAACPDCVSQMTTNDEFSRYLNYTGVDWESLDIAANIAISGGANTVLFTGKGEPTLYPKQINDYLEYLSDQKYFPLAVMEIQTNALLFQQDNYCGDDGWLRKWYKKKLRVISISIVGVSDEENRAFFVPERDTYPSLTKTIKILHEIGYTVRLNVTMMKPYVNNIEKIDKVVKFCQTNKVEQLSVRPVRRPKVLNSSGERAKKVFEWVGENELTMQQEKEIAEYFRSCKEARLLRNLVHGAKVYDYKGQNLCLTDCLTSAVDNEDEVRQLIFYSGGLIAYDWSSPAANILGWGPAARRFMA